ncbi:MAG TPA: hypothetical protein VGD43_19810, partial [Micromonospora sp.]
RYAQQYVCVGGNSLRIRVSGAGVPPRPVEVACDGVPGDLVLSAPATRVSVSVRRPHATPVEYAAQLVRLP